ncbi:MAG: hypothetical protein ACKVOW_16540 [Chitinophagaceae bacterium]
MKKILLPLVLSIVIAYSAKAQDTKAESNKEFMQITTVESVIGGGLGRSKMLITNSDGSQKENEMNNLFSLVGINFKNIKENEDQIIKTLRSYTLEGWKLEQVTPLTVSPGNNGPGIFMTRYLLSRPESKKN